MKAAPVRVLIAALACAFLATAALAAEKEGEKATPRKQRHEVVRILADQLLESLNRDARETALRERREKNWKERLKESAWEVRKWWKGDEATAEPVRRIALWPFWKDKSVVTEDFAQMLNDSLLAALIQGKGANDRYMARDELKVVTRELDEFSSLREASEKISNLMRQAGADVLIIGEVKPDPAGKSVHVHYDAVKVASGEVVATTSWYTLRYDFDQTAAVGVNEAIEAGARHFRKSLSTIRTVRPQGIRYRDSGVQTPFGKWLAGRVIAALKQSAGRGETIIIGDAVVPESKFRKRGLKLSERTAESEMIAEASGDYVLSGEYWDLGDTVDLRLKMSSGAGNDVSWQGNVRRESISGDLALKPTKDYRDERKNDNLGPITLRISSNRGRNPIYKIGQKMILFVEASQDSYLYCFYRQADGSVMRIFPNRHHGDARIAGGSPQKIPGQSMKFDWTIAEPVGTEIAKCHAFDRDVERSLPRMIRKLDFEPLPYRSLAEVSAALRQIRGVGIAETSIVVNVER
jgi:hypothetical protein